MKYINKKGEMTWQFVLMALAIFALAAYLIFGGKIFGQGFNELDSYNDCGNFITKGVCIDDRDRCLDMYEGAVRQNNKDCEKTEHPICCASPEFDDCKEGDTKGVCLHSDDCSALEGTPGSADDCKTTDTICCTGTEI